MDNEHKFIDANGMNFHVVTQGEGPLVLMLHGFPESWYSWRHQFAPLAELGFKVAAPDLRGYGASSAPAGIENYSLECLSKDVIGIIKALGYEQAILVGHDWGAVLAWETACLYPDVIKAIASLSVPYLKRSNEQPMPKMRELFKDQFFYQLYFQEPGVAESEFEADIRTFLLKMLVGASGDSHINVDLIKAEPESEGLLVNVPLPDKLPSWLNATDLLIYESALYKNGLSGPLNWYRNFDENWRYTEHLADARVPQPAFFMIGEHDPVYLFTKSSVDEIEELVPKLKVNEMVPGMGHWLQQEAPKIVNDALTKWLVEL